MAFIVINDEFEDATKIEFIIYKMIQNKGENYEFKKLVKVIDRQSLYELLSIFDYADSLTLVEIYAMINNHPLYIKKMLKDLIDLGFIGRREKNNDSSK